MRANSIICWKVFRVERLTVFRPLKSVSSWNVITQWTTYAKDMALTHRKSESVKVTLLDGVEAPQKMSPDNRHVPMNWTVSAIAVKSGECNRVRPTYVDVVYGNEVERRQVLMEHAANSAKGR